MKNMFIFGAGFSGCALGRAIGGRTIEGRAIGQTASLSLYGTSRSERNFPRIKASGITPLLFDSKNITDDIKQVLAHTSHLIISIAPDEIGDPVLNLGDFSELKKWMPQLQWIAYLSTVGVYGDAQGNWVDENTPCTPTHQRSIMRLEAEKQWQDFAHFADITLCIMRLAGIYGPGRNVFVKLREGRAQRIIKENQVFNRIHCDDIAGSILYLGEKKTQGIFNLADDEPAPPQDLITYGAQLMGVEPPAEIAFEQANLSGMARSFYEENRRISNKKLHDSGYQLIFPNYRKALDTMWQQNIL